MLTKCIFNFWIASNHDNFQNALPQRNLKKSIETLIVSHIRSSFTRELISSKNSSHSPKKQQNPCNISARFHLFCSVSCTNIFPQKLFFPSYSTIFCCDNFWSFRTSCTADVPTSIIIFWHEDIIHFSYFLVGSMRRATFCWLIELLGSSHYSSYNHFDILLNAWLDRTLICGARLDPVQHSCLLFTWIGIRTFKQVCTFLFAPQIDYCHNLFKVFRRHFIFINWPLANYRLI